jgi:hypothetical protein
VACGEDLAWRVRAVLPPAEAVTERQMFGGLAFMLSGHMFCGVVRGLAVQRWGSGWPRRRRSPARCRPGQLPGSPASSGDAARGVTAVRQIRAGLQPHHLSINLLRNKMVVVVSGASQ